MTSLSPKKQDVRRVVTVLKHIKSMIFLVASNRKAVDLTAPYDERMRKWTVTLSIDPSDAREVIGENDCYLDVLRGMLAMALQGDLAKRVELQADPNAYIHWAEAKCSVQTTACGCITTGAIIGLEKTNAITCPKCIPLYKVAVAKSAKTAADAAHQAHCESVLADERARN